MGKSMQIKNILDRAFKRPKNIDLLSYFGNEETGNYAPVHCMAKTRLEDNNLNFRIDPNFFSSPAWDFDNNIQTAIRQFGELFDIHSIVFAYFSDKMGTLEPLYSYNAFNAAMVQEIIGKNIHRWILNKILAGETIVVPHEEGNLKDENFWNEYLVGKGIHSLVVLPLLILNKAVGAFFFFSPDANRCFSKDEVDQISFFGETLTYIMETEGRLGQNNILLKFEQLISETSSTIINPNIKNLDETIYSAIGRICIFFNGDRSALWLLNDDKTFFYPTVVWPNKHKNIDKQALADSFSGNVSHLPWNTLLQGEVIHYEHPDSIPRDEAGLKNAFKKSGAKSIIIAPFSVGGSVTGGISIVSTSTYRKWPEKLIQRLKLLGEIMGNAIIRQNREKDLIKAYKTIKSLKNTLASDNSYLKEEIKHSQSLNEFIGKSPAIEKLFSEIQEAAPTDANVLILGETGTGKELVAQAIHGMSLRKDRPMIKVNCAALPDNLIENELFGHEKGAFTDALIKKKGRFDLADGTSIFLDEIGEIPINVQPKLLRVLENGEFERLGGTKTNKTDVRIIAATNQDLEKKIKQGKFRQDLWYRLKVFLFRIPPLRERLEDIPLLVRFFVKKYSVKTGKKIELAGEKQLNKLKEYDWPGNVRELEHFIERAVIINRGNKLHGEDLSKLLYREIPVKKNTPEKDMSLSEMERAHIVKILEQTNGRVRGPKGAAKILGMHPSTLRYRMKKLGISKEILFA